MGRGGLGKVVASWFRELYVAMCVYAVGRQWRDLRDICAADFVVLSSGTGEWSIGKGKSGLCGYALCNKSSSFDGIGRIHQKGRWSLSYNYGKRYKFCEFFYHLQ